MAKKKYEKKNVIEAYDNEIQWVEEIKRKKENMFISKKSVET